MAEVLDDYQWERKRNSKYPWEIWLDGRVWKLTKGVDFDCSVNSMRLAAFSKAKRDGTTLNIVMDGECVVLQAVKHT